MKQCMENQRLYLHYFHCGGKKGIHHDGSIVTLDYRSGSECGGWDVVGVDICVDRESDRGYSAIYSSNRFLISTQFIDFTIFSSYM